MEDFVLFFEPNHLCGDGDVFVSRLLAEFVSVHEWRSRRPLRNNHRRFLIRSGMDRYTENEVVNRLLREYGAHPPSGFYELNDDEWVMLKCADKPTDEDAVQKVKRALEIWSIGDRIVAAEQTSVDCAYGAEMYWVMEDPMDKGIRDHFRREIKNAPAWATNLVKIEYGHGGMRFTR